MKLTTWLFSRIASFAVYRKSVKTEKFSLESSFVYGNALDV